LAVGLLPAAAKFVKVRLNRRTPSVSAKIFGAYAVFMTDR